LVYENIFGYIQEIKAILDRKEFKARLDHKWVWWFLS
jgi:hypothetical protein